MRCLVTGATGHIGSFLVRRLLAQGAEVAAVARPGGDRRRIADLAGSLRLIETDLAGLAGARAELAAFAPETVFHLAWGGVTSEFRNDQLQLTANVRDSLSVLELAQDIGARAWISVGSQAEYGPYDRPLVESLPLRPVTGYGVAKVALGMLAQKFCAMAGMRFAWLRLMATYGPGDDPRHLIPAVIDQLLAGDRPALTPGEQTCDYLYIDDVVEALWLAAAGEAEGVFNLGSGATASVRAIVEQIRDLIDPALPLGLGDLAYRPDQLMHFQGDSSLLAAATGWQPRVGLADGLRRTVDWHRAGGTQ
ncbi:MAG TPA: NAD-dependent epimerase/dehydratase family protein [Herpetosiphonaceae bacterium]